MSAAQQVNVGIIGGGLMGKEAAAAMGRWITLEDAPVRPRLTAVCDVDAAALAWFDRVDTVTTRVSDYRDLLADDSVDVLYIAVRHDLHEQMYVDAARAGKDFLGEKPFGIDLGAAERIVAAIDEAGVFVRCSSELPFFPGAQAAIDRVRSGELGQIVEATNFLSHSSDLDPDKPLNWKRRKEFCGEAGVMNDLGMHVLHVPLRLGWLPQSVYAVLQDLVPTRPGPSGAREPCDTFENATLLCTIDAPTGRFPLHLGMKRIDPGQKNTWALRVLGLQGGVEFSTRQPRTLWVMKVDDGEQVWQDVQMGSQFAFPTATGAIFETGFSDSILQMWAAFLFERAGQLGGRFGCVTPAEALDSHRVFTAALQSNTSGRSVDPALVGVEPASRH